MKVLAQCLIAAATISGTSAAAAAAAMGYISTFDLPDCVTAGGVAQPDNLDLPMGTCVQIPEFTSFHGGAMTACPKGKKAAVMAYTGDTCDGDSVSAGTLPANGGPGACTEIAVKVGFIPDAHPVLRPTNLADCKNALRTLVQQPGFKHSYRFSRNPRRGVQVPTGWRAGDCLILLSCENDYDADTFSYVDVLRGAKFVVDQHTGQYYNFSNIRYAAPPLGPLRFSDPQPPLNERSLGVQNGNNASICPQAAPSSWNWLNEGLPDGQVIPIGNSTLPQSEDCLYLDVVVPERVFRRRNGAKLAPVMVNIHGGGFFIGDKATLYPPQGLLAASENEMIFVSMNYRLTAFGFLGGLDSAPSNQTSPNAGLLDQRQALKWIQEYIHLFGGDPRQVTIYGESGGGASVMFHAVAYGGTKETDLFQRIVGQSPGPEVGQAKTQKLAGEAYLRTLGVKSADEARRLPTEDLIKANAMVESELPYFGPLVDGDLVPDFPSRLYTTGRHVPNLQVMSAHNSDEARLFIPPTSNSSSAFDDFLASQFPTASPSQISYLNHTLYPPPPTPNHPYTSQFGRLSLLDADVYNLCWTALLSATYSRTGAHNFIFGVDPGYHAQDLAYTFYNGQQFQKDVNVTVAQTLQRAVANFVLHGNPNGGRERGPQFPQWTADLNVVIQGGDAAVSQAPVLKLTNEGFLEGQESAAGRCGWFFQTAFANSN
ncbi:Alpha/Beta hydrolase protein [Usnea florida]